jgi:hypothetical protein
MPGFYRDSLGRVIGPISSAELKKLAGTNVITRDTMIAPKQEGPWINAGRIRGLFDATLEAKVQPVAPHQQMHCIARAEPDSLPRSSVAGRLSFKVVSALRGSFSVCVALLQRRAVLVAALVSFVFLLLAGVVGVVRSSPRTAADARDKKVPPGRFSSSVMPWAHSVTEKTPWRPGAPAEEDSSDALIDDVIENTLGEPSSAFVAASFRGVTLGCPASSIIDETISGSCNCVLGIKPTVIQDAAEGDRQSTVGVYVDKRSDRVVGVIASYRLPLQAMTGYIRDTFGSSRKIVTGPGDSVHVTYLFPETVVVVHSISRRTSILMVDKNYLLSDLHRFAQAVVASAKWMRSTVEANSPNSTGEVIVRKLADTVIDKSQNGAVAMCVDQRLRDRMTLDRGNGKRFETAEDPRTCDVAAVRRDDRRGLFAVMVDPRVSSSVGVSLLKSRGISYDSGLECTLCDTPVFQLFWDIANTLMQLEFPPSTSEISVLFNPAYSVYRGGDNDDNDERKPPDERCQLFEGLRTTAPRYEWVDEDQQVVTVGANLLLKIVCKQKVGL